MAAGVRSRWIYERPLLSTALLPVYDLRYVQYLFHTLVATDISKFPQSHS